MQIRNRLFSYPVYSSDVDDYKSNTFTFDYNAESNGDTVLIQYTTTISNKHILKELNNSTIKLALMIECAKTAYRNLFVLKDSDGTIEVPSSSLSSKVEMCCLLLANEDYIIDKESGISSDYMDTSFKINKGFIVGYDNTYSFIVDKDKEDEFKASSIISVVKKIDLKDYMDIDLDNDNKIKIQLGDEMYQRFVQIQGQDKLPVVHSMIVLPALVYVIDQIKNKDLRETYSDYYWYRCIDKQLEVLNIGIDSSAFDNKSSLAIAQELLKLPINHALINLTTEEGGE
mgnify:FL=1